mmetsp:Transcript_16974/g.27467  ORF Transcript_16974/g.27467 Transcript_16974/m.27467 type:complete len:116 (+) Transcript_16974:257-604(+)
MIFVAYKTKTKKHICLNIRRRQDAITTGLEIVPNIPFEVELKERYNEFANISEQNMPKAVVKEMNEMLLEETLSRQESIEKTCMFKRPVSSNGCRVTSTFFQMRSKAKGIDSNVK